MDKPKVNLSDVEISANTYRFDQAFFDCETSHFGRCIDSLEEKFYPFFQSGDSAFWYRQRTDSLLNSLHADLSKRESNIEKALNSSTDVLLHYEHYFPGKSPRRIYTYISPLDFEFPLFVADSLVFIALDQYLGGNSPFYQSQATYLLRGKDLPFLPLDLAESLAQQQVKQDLGGQRDLLTDMIYEGKVLYLASMLYPIQNEARWLRYSPSEWQFCLDNEANIWSYLVEQQTLFSSDADLKRRLILPAPFTKFYLPIDNQTPGRVGRWVGYRIVESWMKEHDYNVELMLRSTDARSFLRDAKYKP